MGKNAIDGRGEAAAVAMDVTFVDRENASKHYCHCTNYRVQTLKTTVLVDTASQAILDVHCTTKKRHDMQLGWQFTRVAAGELPSLAADKAMTGNAYAIRFGEWT